MKYILAFSTLLLADAVFAQPELPVFLTGTWKTENREAYEHWDSLSDHTLKGVAYRVEDGQMTVSEYLDIARKGNAVVYTATVTGQNQGKGVDFTLTQSDSIWAFENPGHDFPKKIVYRKLTDEELLVQVSGEKQKGFAYKMKKQQAASAAKDSAVANPGYDPVLARKLGADDYGMKSYVLVLLRTGANRTADKALVSSSFRGHLENINRLVKEGKLIVAGPLEKNADNYRGIFILNEMADLEAARALLQTDPAIKAGLLDAELYRWYGSAALPEYLPAADRIWKVKP